MNTVEMLQARVMVLEARLRKLEIEFGASRQTRGDEAEAQRVAQDFGFTISVLWERKSIAERKRVATELRRRRWSHERISRVLYCSSRTVERNFSR